MKITYLIITLILLSGCKTTSSWMIPSNATLITTVGERGHSMWSYNNGYAFKGVIHDFNCRCKIKERDMDVVYQIQREKNHKGGPGAREEHITWRKGLKR